MIKRLRLKFIVINMGIATILLSAILGLVFYFTSANLETESIRMMERIASQPFQMDAPGELGRTCACPSSRCSSAPRRAAGRQRRLLRPVRRRLSGRPGPGRRGLPAAWGCWRSITCAITARRTHEPLPGVRGHLQ